MHWIKIFFFLFFLYLLVIQIIPTRVKLYKNVNNTEYFIYINLFMCYLSIQKRKKTRKK